MTAPIRVLVVDDDAGARALHTRWVAATVGFSVVGSAASGRAALGFVEHGVDLVLLDMRLPDRCIACASRARPAQTCSS